MLLFAISAERLSVGKSVDVNMSKYTYNSNGLAIPPCYGNPTSLIVSDTTVLQAVWLDNSTIRITMINSYPGMKSVDVIASPNGTSPYTPDLDKERIEIYTNDFNIGGFNFADDTMGYGYEAAPGRSSLANVGWVASANDSQGVQADGVMTLTFPSGSAGIKGTPYSGNRINYQTHLLH